MPDVRRIANSQIGRISLIFLSVFAALCAINFASLPFAAPCVEPIIEQQTNDSITSANQRNSCPEAKGIVSAGISLIGQGIARITDWTPETWTAACTAILALVTLGLAIATGNQVRLARAEFAATHRPRLRVRSTQLTYIEADQVPQGRLTIVNIGDSAATITQLSADIICRIGKVFGEGRPNLGNIGRVTYADANGAIRTTGFFRSYDRAREYCVRENETDYEYED